MRFSDNCNSLSSSLHFLENFIYVTDNMLIIVNNREFWYVNNRVNLCALSQKLLDLMYLFSTSVHVYVDELCWHFC